MFSHCIFVLISHYRSVYHRHRRKIPVIHSGPTQLERNYNKYEGLNDSFIQAHKLRYGDNKLVVHEYELVQIQDAYALQACQYNTDDNNRIMQEYEFDRIFKEIFGADKNLKAVGATRNLTVEDTESVL